MKSRNLLLSIPLFLFLFVSNGSGADLWHFFDQETGSTLGYVYKGLNDVTFYDANWRRLHQRDRDGGDELEFSYYSSGNLRIVIRFKFVDDRPEGHWVLVHTQTRTRKELRYERIEVEEGWTPWKVLTEGKGDSDILDVFGILKGKAEELSREEFADYWITSVEPDYYPVFCLLLYKEKGFGFSVEERKEKAGKVYESLKSAPAVNLAEIYKEVLTDLQEKYPWFRNNRGVLFFPSLDNPKVTQLTLEDLTPKLVMNTSSMFGDYDPVRFKYYLAQSLMYEYFQNTSSLGGVGGVEDYILLGVSLNLIAELGYGGPSDYLFLENEDALEGIVERYHETRKSFLDETRGGQTWRRAEDDKLSEYYYLAYQFGGLLMEYYEPEDMRSYKNMNSIKRSFQNFLKYEDSKVRQLPLK